MTNDEKRELAIQRILSNARYGAINAVEKDLRELLATPGRAVEGFDGFDLCNTVLAAIHMAEHSWNWSTDALVKLNRATRAARSLKDYFAASPSPASEPKQKEYEAHMYGTWPVTRPKASEPSGVAKGQEKEARETCVCGAPMAGHGIGEGGHSPVSMYDHYLATPQPQASAEKVGETPRSNALFAQLEGDKVNVFDALPKIQEFARQLERELNARREEMREALGKFIDAVEKLAFSMPAPNTYTPQFIGLCVSARAALHPKAEGTKSE